MGEITGVTILTPVSFIVSWQNDCFSTTDLKNWEIDKGPLKHHSNWSFQVL